MNKLRRFYFLPLLFLILVTAQPASAGTWTEVNGVLAFARQGHTATLLSNGKVLVAGGLLNNSDLKSCQLYDPATGTWSGTGDLNTGRFNHTATLLKNGKVLVVGGSGAYSTVRSSCELYDPITGTWTETSQSLSTGRWYHTATLLTNGNVLVAGGQSLESGIISSCELYNTSADSWTITDSLTYARVNHTATLLPSGSVLVAGGFAGSNDNSPLSSAELYSGSTWTDTGSMPGSRGRHTATLRNNGYVLVAGGKNASSTIMSCYSYNSSSGIWAILFSGGLNIARHGHTATLLPNGNVLITGGSDNNGDSVSSSESFNGSSWSLAGDLTTARTGHTATMLSTGNVLITAGWFSDDVTSFTVASSELYDMSEDGNWATVAGTMTTYRRNHTATLRPDGSVIIAGGDNLSGTLITTNIYASGTWSSGNMMYYARTNHTATLLPNGNVLVAGGTGDAGAPYTGEYFNGDYWTETEFMHSDHANHTATLLPDGKVLIVGGRDGDVAIDVSEIYDPASDTWTATTGKLNRARWDHTATLLPDGRVLVTGGVYRDGGEYIYINTAEIYDPAEDFWIPTDNMNANRSRHTATLLPNGNVLVAGGYVGLQMDSAELYDPDLGLWRSTGNLNMTRASHTATLLPSGKVMVAGGSFYLSYSTPACEVYDPSTESWFVTDALTGARYSHTATLLPGNQILMAGGDGGMMADLFNNGEIYDPGFGFDPSWQPSLSTVASVYEVGHDPLEVYGSGFLGMSEASDGSNNNSATNYPLIQVRRIEGEYLKYIPYNPALSAQDTVINAMPIKDFPDGHALVTVLTNGIPSESWITIIDNPPTVSSVVRTDPNPTSAASVGYTVTFNKPVVGVDANDFSLVTSLTGATVSSVTGGNSVYNVTIENYSGQGMLSLNLIDNDTILDLFDIPLHGTGVGSLQRQGDSDDNISDNFKWLSPLTKGSHNIGLYTPFTSGSSPVIITEINLNSPDFVEIQNVSYQVVDTSGWVVAVSSQYNDINAVNTTLWELPPTVEAGQVLYRTDTSDENYWGGNILWAMNNTGWAMIVDDTGNVMDFIAWGWAAADVSNMSPVINGQTITMTEPATIDDQFMQPVAYSQGDIYEIDRVPPMVEYIVCADPNPTAFNTVNYTVTFSEQVVGVDASDFDLYRTGSLAGGAVSIVSGSGSIYTVTVNGYNGDGELRLDLDDDDSITDILGNPLEGENDPDGSFTGLAYDIDMVPPTVLSITRANSSPTNAAAVDFIVTFSEAVAGVDQSDFDLPPENTVTGGDVLSVSPDAITYSNTFTVTVYDYSGAGSLRLDLSDNDSIHDTLNNILGGVGTGNGDFDSGEVYAIDRTPPEVTSIVRANTSPTNAASVDFTVTFSENVNGVDTGDFTLFTSLTDGFVLNVIGSGDNYTVTVGGYSGVGDLRLDLVDNDSIMDNVGNPPNGVGFGNGNYNTGEVYLVDRIVPTVTAVDVHNSSTADITFSEPMTGGSGVYSVGNYLVSGTGQGNLAGQPEPS